MKNSCATLTEIFAPEISFITFGNNLYLCISLSLSSVFAFNTISLYFFRSNIITFDNIFLTLFLCLYLYTMSLSLKLSSPIYFSFDLRSFPISFSNKSLHLATISLYFCFYKLYPLSLSLILSLHIFYLKYYIHLSFSIFRLFL